jgi:molybdate-binding protein/DNA-binding XRE family transcriptional regulator
MDNAESNRVRELRDARGLSQTALATAIGLTRQSVHAIEAGRAIPAVDVALRIARVLDCTVESLFGATAIDVRLVTEPVTEAKAGRVALANISGRWLSYSLDREGIRRSADALVAQSKDERVEVDELRSSAELRENVVIMGCAPALGLLADRLNAHPGPGRFLWFGRSSMKALEALERRQTHVAGVHLVDLKTGESNVPDVRRHNQKRAVVLITLARWEVGIVVDSGNAKGISQISHLGRRGVRLVSREPGSGARRLLERELKRAELSLNIARESALQASGHLEVAHAVAIGAGDAGIATRDAALAFGLKFLPIAEERYDLVVARDELNDPRLARLFDVMTAAPLRRELSSLGYDVGQCGDRVAEILAA